jgi:hypothetical protein
MCRRWLRAQGEVLAGDLGELSRLGALKMAVSRQTTDPTAIGRRFLVDHSEQKSGGTEEMFGVRLPVVNPFRCFRGVDLRFLVLVSLLCRRRSNANLLLLRLRSHSVAKWMNHSRRTSGIHTTWSVLLSQSYCRTCTSTCLPRSIRQFEMLSPCTPSQQSSTFKA